VISILHRALRIDGLDQLPPTLRGVRGRDTKPGVVVPLHGWCVCGFGGRVDEAAVAGAGAGSGASAAATARAAVASASSFSRQQCLYLRPEPQWQGSLRPGRATVRAVIMKVYSTRASGLRESPDVRWRVGAPAHGAVPKPIRMSAGAGRSRAAGALPGSAPHRPLKALRPLRAWRVIVVLGNSAASSWRALQNQSKRSNDEQRGARRDRKRLSMWMSARSALNVVISILQRTLRCLHFVLSCFRGVFSKSAFQNYNDEQRRGRRRAFDKYLCVLCELCV
jgi:hypothetical protein